MERYSGSTSSESPTPYPQEVHFKVVTFSFFSALFFFYYLSFTFLSLNILFSDMQYFYSPSNTLYSMLV